MPCERPTARRSRRRRSPAAVEEFHRRNEEARLIEARAAGADGARRPPVRDRAGRPARAVVLELASQPSRPPVARRRMYASGAWHDAVPVSTTARRWPRAPDRRAPPSCRAGSPRSCSAPATWPRCSPMGTPSSSCPKSTEGGPHVDAGGTRGVRPVGRRPRPRARLRGGDARAARPERRPGAAGQRCFETFFTKEAPPSRVRQAEPLGFDPELWAKLGELGGPMMGVPEDAGGGGASLLDLVLVAEQFGASLAPGPACRAAVTARLLAAAGAPARDVLEPMASSPPAVGAMAMRPAADGVARLVPAGAIADVVVGLDGDELVAVVVSAEGAASANLGAGPVADRSLRPGDRHRARRGSRRLGAHGAAVDEWRVLTAGALVGLAAAPSTSASSTPRAATSSASRSGRSSRSPRDLADAATAVDGARLLAREAAWAAVEDTACVRVARQHGVPVRGPDRPAGDRRRPPRPRRLRLHARVRHPALLPAGQGLAAGAPAIRDGACTTWPTPLRTRRGRTDGLPARGQERRLPGGGP